MPKPIFKGTLPGEYWRLDVWDLHDLFSQQELITCGHRYLDFTEFYQPWLSLAVKKFTKYNLATKAISTTANRQVSLLNFSRFLKDKYPGIQTSEINRAVIVDYLTHLSGLAISTRNHRLVDLKTFIELCVREGWAELPDKQLIYKEDFSRCRQTQPRFIPEEVLDQLNQYLDALPIHMMAMVIVLQESGMRISELCTLPLDCLMQDSQGDWFLHYYQHKMKKPHSIPISESVAGVIQKQQQLVRIKYDQAAIYLFHPVFKQDVNQERVKPISRKGFTKALNKLAARKNICDSTGKLWHFQPHQFRHTVGTQMINNGVPQYIVQKFLGHESPEMTSVYAQLHDRTLKEEFAKFKGKTVDVSGRIFESSNDNPADVDELQWLKKNIQAQALPNGYCGLPSLGSKPAPCPHANACLSCGHFRTTVEFLSIHKAQLENTEKIIETATANGWQRQVEMNEKIRTNLKNIISSLEVNYDSY